MFPHQIRGNSVYELPRHPIKPIISVIIRQVNSGPRVGSAVIVMDGENVLLGRRAKDPNRGKWVIPGGKIEPFETISDAARRELREETGLEIEVVSQLGVFEIVNPPEEHRIIVYSWGRVTGGELKAASDVSDLKFVNKWEIPQLEVTDFVRGVLKAAGLVPPTSLGLREVG